MFTIIARSTIASTPSMSIIIVSIIILLLALPLSLALLSITKEFRSTGAKERTQAC